MIGIFTIAQYGIKVCFSSIAPLASMRSPTLKGMLLFGLTTAFLFAMIQEVRLLALREGDRDR